MLWTVYYMCIWDRFISAIFSNMSKDASVVQSYISSTRNIQVVSLAKTVNYLLLFSIFSAPAL